MGDSSLEKFLQERIKIGGKAGALGNTVTVTREKSRDSNFSKRMEPLYDSGVRNSSTVLERRG